MVQRWRNSKTDRCSQFRRRSSALVLGIAAGSTTIAGCTGPRPTLVDPIPEPTLDVVAFADSLPTSSREPLAPTDPDAPGEPTAQDALWVWGQRAGLNYQGPCESLVTIIDDAVCSAEVENFDVFRVGPDAEETWWVVAVEGSEASYRVTEVYLAGAA